MPVRIETHSEPIPGYRLIERLGCGGFGEVWKAEAPGGLLKAIKFVYGDLESMDNSGGARAMQEMKALERVKSVRHPYILNLERYDIIDGQLLIVMELADRSLWDRYRDCRNAGLPGVPRAELLSYLYEAAEALDFMNERYNLQHLDIKPQNLFLVFNHVKVADFGLVKVLEGTQASVTGGVTPVYAAPETLLDGQVTRFSDQYSLAIVYQEMLTGQRPYTGANTRQLIMQRLEGTPNLSVLASAEQPIVGRALSKEPAGRFPSCRDFVAALIHAGGGWRPASGAIDDTPGPLGLSAVGLLTPPNLTPDQIESTNLVRPQLVDRSLVDAAPSLRIAPDVEEHAESSAEARHEEPISAESPASSNWRTEQLGEGVLAPSLLIGLGQFGRNVLQGFRNLLVQRFPKIESLPHLRLLAVDLDPDAAVMGNTRGLASDEVLLTKLNRPGNYVKPRPGMPPLDDWIPQNLIYRIPRSGLSTGLRVLGRLALVDHAKSLAARLKRDLERITAPEAMKASDERTGLGCRTNWPTVYVVAHLAGGTGSGMFIDMAYLVRQQLRELGYDRQDVVGVLLVPPVNDPEWTDLALANTFGALTELGHFQNPAVSYRARLEERGKALEDPHPPFTRCILIPTPGDESASRSEAASLLGDFLYRELLTPLGREAEKLRMLAKPAGDQPGAITTCGLHVLAAPRRPLVRQAAARLCQELLTQWTGKSLSQQAGQIQQEVQQMLSQCQLEPQPLLDQLQASCTRELGESVPAAIARWVAPLKQMTPGGYPDPKLVHDALQQASSLLGSPEDNNSLRPSPVTVIARATMDHLVKQAGPRLLAGLLRYLDVPGYRVAGAEEAIRFASTTIEGWLKAFEQQVEGATLQMRALLERLQPELAEWDRLVKAGSRARRIPSFSTSDLIGKAAMLRYEQILHQALTSIFVSVRGKLSDQVKDLRFCRTRLSDMQKLFDDQLKSQALAQPASQEILLPPGCNTLNDAAQRTLKGITSEQMAALDVRVQKAMQRQFQPLGQLCLLPGEWPRQLQTLMLHESEHYLEQLLPHQDAAELLMQRCPPPQQLADELQSSLDEAEPLLSERPQETPSEFALLLTPNSDAGRQLASFAESLGLGVHVAAANGCEEVVCYREYGGILLGEIKQLGPAAKEAYDLACSLENVSPHSRLDIKKWQPGDKHRT